MDVLAHMLWTNYGAQTANKRLKKKDKRVINLFWVTFWGVFPDLFAFGITFLISIPLMFSKGFDGRTLMGHISLPAMLYQYSHSLVIWLAVFLIVWLIFKKPRLELLGWALHILIDIPSHAATFYPTPFLFPISNYRFLHGVSWASTTYMIINYSLLLVSTIYLMHRKHKAKS